MSKTITRQQELQLRGILALAARYNDIERDLVAIASEITREEDAAGGFTGDAIYGATGTGSEGVVDLLARLRITVADQ